MDDLAAKLEAELEALLSKYFAELRPAEIISAIESAKHEFIKEAMGL